MWETDKQQPAMIELRQFVQHRVLPALSSTHKTEFFVRNTQLCATSKRGEALSSRVSVVRQCCGKRVSRETAPKHGEPTKRPARGKERNKALVRVAERSFFRIWTLENVPKREALFDSFKGNSNSSVQKRTNDLVDKSRNAEFKWTNKKMRQEGVDCSAAPLGMLAFSELAADEHRHAVVEELQLQNVQVDDLGSEPNWSTLQKRLKKAESCDEKNEPKLWFKPLTASLKAFLKGLRPSNQDGSNEQIVC
jgi:hypothetical protein